MPKKKTTPKKHVEAFVLDGSVALAWCFSDEADPYADAVARALPGTGAVVPALWHLEVTNALLVGERRGRCDRADTARWTAFLASLPLTVDEPSAARVFGEVTALARVQNLSAYDAVYLDLALRRGLPLATLDKPLRAAATAVGIDLFDPAA